MNKLETVTKERIARVLEDINQLEDLKFNNKHILIEALKDKLARLYKMLEEGK